MSAVTKLQNRAHGLFLRDRALDAELVDFLVLGWWFRREVLPKSVQRKGTSDLARPCNRAQVRVALRGNVHRNLGSHVNSPEQLLECSERSTTIVIFKKSVTGALFR